MNINWSNWFIQWKDLRTGRWSRIHYQDPARRSHTLCGHELPTTDHYVVTTNVRNGWICTRCDRRAEKNP